MKIFRLIKKGLKNGLRKKLLSNRQFSLGPLTVPRSIVTLAALTVMINSWVAMDMTKDVVLNNELFPSDHNCEQATFDYIIVGAGTAGMVVATRLANASMNARVLLLEAGGEPYALNNLPIMNWFMLNQPVNMWMYKSTQQKNSCGLCVDKRTLISRGKMLGGCTNFMAYSRGNKHDFNRWALDANDTEWSYESVLPYFKKSENYNGAYTYESTANKYHGRGGLLNVATHDYMPGVDDFLAAGVEKGHVVGDYNGENQEVFSKMDITTENGWRESTYRAFYTDAGRPPNLCIKKYAHVTKIILDDNTLTRIRRKPRASGVVYKRHFQTRTVHATKEVILSAGTIESAKLLLLSGVGPAEHLKKFNIPLINDIPVGHNLQDHLYTLVGPFLKGPSANPKTNFNSKTVSNFLRTGGGPLAAPFGSAGTAFFQSTVAEPAYPDLQVMQYSISMYPELPQDLNKFIGLDSSKISEWLHPYHKSNSGARFLLLILGRPKSTGSIRLASTNPNDNPIIDPQYLSHPDDMEALLFGFKKMVDLYQNSSALNIPLFPKPVPGCESENIKFQSDQYYRCVIKQLSGSFYDHVGTCALGKVVDSKLRVKGIDGLRVIDASVMPRVPNANTQAATIMIAEKGADHIIRENQKE